MKQEYEFSIGQQVKIWDDDYKKWVPGKVTGKTDKSVFIKWVDFNEPTEHQRWEFEDIKLIHPTP